MAIIHVSQHKGDDIYRIPVQHDITQISQVILAASKEDPLKSVNKYAELFSEMEKFYTDKFVENHK